MYTVAGPSILVKKHSLYQVQQTECIVCVLSEVLFFSLFCRITEEMNAIQELRSLISSELERMKCLLSERRKMLLAGATRNPVCHGVTQKVALSLK